MHTTTLIEHLPGTILIPHLYHWAYSLQLVYDVNISNPLYQQGDRLRMAAYLSKSAPPDPTNWIILYLLNLQFDAPFPT